MEHGPQSGHPRVHYRLSLLRAFIRKGEVATEAAVVKHSNHLGRIWAIVVSPITFLQLDAFGSHPLITYAPAIMQAELTIWIIKSQFILSLPCGINCTRRQKARPG
jgi:hypothetical protein